MSPGRIFRNHSLFYIHTHPQISEKVSSGRENQKQTNQPPPPKKNPQKIPYAININLMLPCLYVTFINFAPGGYSCLLGEGGGLSNSRISLSYKDVIIMVKTAYFNIFSVLMAVPTTSSYHSCMWGRCHTRL